MKMATEKRLSGAFRQKLDDKGELYYKGVCHFFSSKMPILVKIVPSGKSLKGEMVYYMYTYVPWYREVFPISPEEQKLLKKLSCNRMTAEVKVLKILNEVGIILKKEKKRYDKRVYKARKKERK